MITQIISELQTRITALPFFSQVFGLTELKEKSEVFRAVYYDGAKWVNVIRDGIGLAYFRKTANVTISNSDSRVSCETLYLINYQCKLFAMTKRNLLPNNSATSPDELASTLIKVLTISGGGDLKRQIGAKILNIRSTGYSTDSAEIIDEELKDSARKDYNFTDIAISIDFEIEITINANCLQNICE